MASPVTSDVTPLSTLETKPTGTCLKRTEPNKSETAQRLVPVRLEIAAARIVFRDGARLLRPTLISLQRSANLPAKHLRLCITQKRELELRHQAHLRSLRVKDLGRSSPLGSVLDNLNKLWEEDTEAHARVLKRARRRTITYYRIRYQATLSEARYNTLSRKSCKDIERNWFSASARPLSMASITDEDVKTGSELPPRSLLGTISESSISPESFGNRGKDPMEDQDNVAPFPEYGEQHHTSPKTAHNPDSVKQRRRQTVVYAEPADGPLFCVDNGNDGAFLRRSISRSGSKRKTRPRSLPAGPARLDTQTHYAVYDPSVYHGGAGEQLVRLVPVTPVLAQARYRHRDDPARVPPGAHLGTNYKTYVKPPRRPLSFSPGDFQQIGHGYNPNDKPEKQEHTGKRSENDNQWEDVSSSRSPSPGPSSLQESLGRTLSNNPDDLDRLKRLLQEHCRLAEPEDPSYHPPNFLSSNPPRTVVDQRISGNRIRSINSTPGRPPITPANSLRRPKRIPSTRSPYSLNRNSSRSSRVPRRTASQRSQRSDSLKEPRVPVVPTIFQMVSPATLPASEMTPQSKRLFETQQELLQRKQKRESVISHEQSSKRASTAVASVHASGSNSPTSGHTMVGTLPAGARSSNDSKVSLPATDRKWKGKERAVESPVDSGSGNMEAARESQDKSKTSGETGTTDGLDPSTTEARVDEMSTGTETPPNEEMKPKEKEKFRRRLLKPYLKVYWLIRHSRYPGGKAPRTAG